MIKSVVKSNIAFALKAMAGLLLTSVVANELSTTDFSTWSILVSMGMYFTLSDFGIGQTLLNTFVSKRVNGNNESVAEDIRVAIAAFVFVIVVFFVSFLIICFNMELLDSLPRWVLTSFLLLVLARTVFIPFAALLSANDFFYIRKYCETITYIFVFVVVWWSLAITGELSWGLLSYAFCFLIGSSLYVITCYSKSLVINNALLPKFDILAIVALLKQSKEYFVNNLSLLITRGGLVFMASFVLSVDSIAKLSIYYLLFYQVVFQFFDIIFRTYQPRFITRSSHNKYFAMMIMLILVIMFFVFLVGSTVFNMFFSTIPFEKESFVVFVFLGIVELGIGLIYSKWVMYEDRKFLVAKYSIVRAVLYSLSIALIAVFDLAVSLAFVLSVFFCITLLFLFLLLFEELKYIKTSVHTNL